MEGSGLTPIDYVLAGIMAIAVLRGIGRGLLRETFSMGSVAAAVIVVRLYNADVTEWLLKTTDGEIGEMAAPWVAGILLVVAGIGATAVLGRVVRRSARTVGLGWADRAGGALLGTAEGLLVVGIVVGLIGYFVGRTHPLLAESKSLAYFEQLEEMASSGELPELDLGLPLPSVAAPPPDPR